MPGTFLSTLSPSVYSQRNRKGKRKRYFNQTLSFPNSKGITSLNSTHLLGPTILEGNLSKMCQAHAKTGLIILPAKPAPIHVSSLLVNGHLVCPVIKVIQQRHHCHCLVRPCLSPTGGSSRPPSLPQALLSIPIATTSVKPHPLPPGPSSQSLPKPPGSPLWSVPPMAPEGLFIPRADPVCPQFTALAVLLGQYPSPSICHWNCSLSSLHKHISFCPEFLPLSLLGELLLISQHPTQIFRVPGRFL